MRRFKFFRGDKKKKKVGPDSWWPTPTPTVVPEDDFQQVPCLHHHLNHNNYNLLHEDLQHPVSASASSSPSTSPSSPTATATTHQRQCHSRTHLHASCPPRKDYKTHFLLRVPLRRLLGLFHPDPRRRRPHCSFTRKSLSSSTSVFFIVLYLLIAALSSLLLPVATAMSAGATATSVHSTEPFMISSTPTSPSSTMQTQQAVHFRDSGEPCTLDMECSGSLICAKPPRAKYSYCDCDGRNYTWSAKLQKCVGLVHSVCTNSETGDKLGCVDNAYCDIKPELGYGLCECTGSYSPTRARSCQLRYGYPCVNQNYDNLCNKDQLLNCIEDVCRCMFPNQMKYDKELGQCRMLVGNSCDPKSEVPASQEDGEDTDSTNTGRRKIHIGCVSGARCVARDETGEHGECQLIEQPTSTSTTAAPFPNTWLGRKNPHLDLHEGTDRDEILRKKDSPTRKEHGRRHPHNYNLSYHHKKRKGSIKNSLADENQEIPAPEAKATSSSASQSSLYIYTILCQFALPIFVYFACQR